MRTSNTHSITLEGSDRMRLRAELTHEEPPEAWSLTFSGAVEGATASEADETLDELLATLRTFLTRSLERD